MKSLLVVGLCLAIGLALQRLRAFPARETARSLNAFVIHVALPALILAQLVRLGTSFTAPLDARLLVPILMPWFVLAVSVGLVLACVRAFSLPDTVRGALLLLVPLGNTSFLGIPLTEAWLGHDAVAYAILYDQLGSFLALTLYGTFVIARYAPPADATTAGPPRALWSRIFLFPPFVALLLAVALVVVLPAGLPPVLDEALLAIAASLVPAVMVAVGLDWKLTLPRRHVGLTGLALGLKLVVAPLLAWAAVVAFGLGGPAADAAIFEAGMGPMITAGALAVAAELEVGLVSAIVGYGTLASLGTSAVLAAILLPT